MNVHLDQDMAKRFKLALRGIAATVCVITAVDGDKRHGMTVTSMTSLTMEPPALLICLNQSAGLMELLRISSGFCVNILSDEHEDVSNAFSGGADGDERFAIGKWRSHDETGLPYLEGAQSAIFCKKTAAIPYGTHMILIGDVTEVIAGNASNPLVYFDTGYVALQATTK